jgi:hypothetical protein
VEKSFVHCSRFTLFDTVAIVVGLGRAPWLATLLPIGIGGEEVLQGLPGGEVRIGLLLNMIMGVLLLEDGKEEVVPLVVVIGGHVELELDVLRDVNIIGGGWEGK